MKNRFSVKSDNVEKSFLNEKFTTTLVIASLVVTVVGFLSSSVLTMSASASVVASASLIQYFSKMKGRSKEVSATSVDRLE